MKLKWDAATPIEIMFSQIDDSQAYATSGNSPYMDAQIVCMAYNLAFQLGKMKEVGRDWRRRPANNKTWTNFVSNFKATHLYLQHESTSGLAGFHAHFSKQAQLNKEFRNVTLANQTHMENLAQANIATTKQVTNLLSTITSLQKQVRTLSTCLHRSGRGNNNNHNTGERGTRLSPRRVNVDLKCADGTRT